MSNLHVLLICLVDKWAQENLFIFIFCHFLILNQGVLKQGKGVSRIRFFGCFNMEKSRPTWNDIGVNLSLMLDALLLAYLMKSLSVLFGIVLMLRRFGILNRGMCFRACSLRNGFLRVTIFLFPCIML